MNNTIRREFVLTISANLMRDVTFRCRIHQFCQMIASLAPYSNSSAINNMLTNYKYNIFAEILEDLGLCVGSSEPFFTNEVCFDVRSARLPSDKYWYHYRTESKNPKWQGDVLYTNVPQDDFVPIDYAMWDAIVEGLGLRDLKFEFIAVAHLSTSDYHRGHVFRFDTAMFRLGVLKLGMADQFRNLPPLNEPSPQRLTEAEIILIDATSRSVNNIGLTRDEAVVHRDKGLLEYLEIRQFRRDMQLDPECKEHRSYLGDRKIYWKDVIKYIPADANEPEDAYIYYYLDIEMKLLMGQVLQKPSVVARPPKAGNPLTWIASDGDAEKHAERVRLIDLYDLIHPYERVFS